MVRCFQAVESTRADFAPNRRVDCVRHLLNDSGILAANSSARRILAFTSSVAIPHSSAFLDGNVGSRSRDHGAVAQCDPL